MAMRLIAFMQLYATLLKAKLKAFQKIFSNLSRFRSIASMEELTTTKELAKQYGVSVQAVSGWRRKAEKMCGYPLGRSSEFDRRVLVFKADEVNLLKQFAPEVETLSGSEIVDADFVEMPTESVGKVSGSLVPLANVAANGSHLTRFDGESAQEQRLSIRTQTRQNAQALNQSLGSYIDTEFQNMLNRIGLTLDAIEANAIAGLQQRLGKPDGSEQQHQSA